MNHHHNHLQAKRKKRSQHNPTGFGHKHVLQLLPQLWKSHSWASKPSCDHLKACLVKLCCLFVILTASSSLDFRVPIQMHKRRTNHSWFQWRKKRSSFVLHPLLLPRKIQVATYFCGHTSNQRNKKKLKPFYLISILKFSFSYIQARKSYLQVSSLVSIYMTN